MKLIIKYLVSVGPVAIWAACLYDYSAPLYYTIAVTWCGFCGWEVWPWIDRYFARRSA